MGALVPRTPYREGPRHHRPGPRHHRRRREPGSGRPPDAGEPKGRCRSPTGSPDAPLDHRCGRCAHRPHRGTAAIHVPSCATEYAAHRSSPRPHSPRLPEAHRSREQLGHGRRPRLVAASPDHPRRPSRACAGPTTSSRIPVPGRGTRRGDRGCAHHGTREAHRPDTARSSMPGTSSTGPGRCPRRSGPLRPARGRAGAGPPVGSPRRPPSPAGARHVVRAVPVPFSASRA